MVQPFDPITLEVMRNMFYSITDEIAMALVHTAYSTNIKDRRDCSCAIYTPSGEVVAQSEIGTPLHLGVMPGVVKTILQRFPISMMEPGDDIVMNIPYPMGPGHLNDITLLSPVFYKDHLVALVANQAHHVDVGGFAPGSMASNVHEIYQEGLQIPPVKIVKRDVVDDELMEFFLANVRTKIESRGDMLAQVSANHVGEKRTIELIEKYGIEKTELYMQEIMDYSERRMRAGIKNLPNGSYDFQDFIEGSGEDGLYNKKIKIQVKVEIQDESIFVDFTGTDPEVRSPLNCRASTALACVYYVVKCIVDPGLPPNSGAYRPITVHVPEGSLVQCTFPSAVAHGNIVTSHRIVDALLGALVSVVPERVVAACSGTQNLLNIGGIHKETGNYYNYIETYGGGQGAMYNSDGMDGVHTHMTNTRNAPIEVIEATYPLKIEGYSLIEDSDGAGEFRGGLGIVRKIRNLSENATLTISSDRNIQGPWGLFGGEEARGAQCVKVKRDGETIPLPSKTTTSLKRGEMVITKTPGGGGWGYPKKRDLHQVQLDVVEGFISIQRARDIYGVVLREDMSIDYEETERLRSL